MSNPYQPAIAVLERQADTLRNNIPIFANEGREDDYRIAMETQQSITLALCSLWKQANHQPDNSETLMEIESERSQDAIMEQRERVLNLCISNQAVGYLDDAIARRLIKSAELVLTWIRKGAQP